MGDYAEVSVASDDFVALTQLFVAINGTDLRVDQINLYDFDGNVIRFGTSTNKHIVDMDSLLWLSPVMELDGGKYISKPYLSRDIIHTSSMSSHYISLYRIFYNRYGGKAGIVETTKSCKSVFKNIISYKTKNDNSPDFYIYDSNGSLIFPYNSADNAMIFPQHNYYSQINEDTNHSFYQPPDASSRELITYINSPYSGWIYLTVQAEDLILAPVNQLTRMIITLSTIVFFLTIFLSLFISRGLTKPIKQLKAVLKQTSVGTLGQGAFSQIDTSYDELDSLALAFEKMSQSLKISMDELLETRQQEVKSRSLALQSQINPHFYYNTLASIQVLAENDDQESIKLMCKHLTSIMRYITNGNFTTVTLRAEIDCVSKYLHCMKIRYQSSLNYKIQIDDELLDKEVPKLIIQPLVENSLKYGTERIPPWDIFVTGKITTSGWEIKITDNGPGFSPGALDLIGKRIKDASSKIGMPDIEINGMGILNVYLRWKLYSKEKGFFEYGNTPEGHAYIIIGMNKFRI